MLDGVRFGRRLFTLLPVRSPGRCIAGLLVRLCKYEQQHEGRRERRACGGEVLDLLARVGLAMLEAQRRLVWIDSGNTRHHLFARHCRHR